jgi:hypothetical protein
MPCHEVRRVIAEGDRRALRSRRVQAHLRDCPLCARFASETFRRTGRLHALTGPLAAGALEGLLSRMSRSASTCGAATWNASNGFIRSAGDNFSAAVIGTKSIIVAGVIVGVAGLVQPGHPPSGSRPVQLPPDTSRAEVAVGAWLRPSAPEARVHSGSRVRKGSRVQQYAQGVRDSRAIGAPAGGARGPPTDPHHRRLSRPPRSAPRFRSVDSTTATATPRTREPARAAQPAPASTSVRGQGVQGHAHHGENAPPRAGRGRAVAHRPRPGRGRDVAHRPRPGRGPGPRHNIPSGAASPPGQGVRAVHGRANRPGEPTGPGSQAGSAPGQTSPSARGKPADPSAMAHPAPPQNNGHDDR